VFFTALKGRGFEFDKVVAPGAASPKAPAKGTAAVKVWTAFVLLGLED
jgi:hypothetical protein